MNEEYERKLKHIREKVREVMSDSSLYQKPEPGFLKKWLNLADPVRKEIASLYALAAVDDSLSDEEYKKIERICRGGAYGFEVIIEVKRREEVDTLDQFFKERTESRNREVKNNLGWLGCFRRKK